MKKIKLSSQEKNLEIINPKEGIILETLDMDIIENINHNNIQVIAILFNNLSDNHISGICFA